MASLELCQISKLFPQKHGEPLCALDAVSLTIESGELVAIVGPSGSGKTTLLRVIAGLEELSGGDVLLAGVSAKAARPHERQVAMVFQDPALLPHLTVHETLALGLKLRHAKSSEIGAAIERVADQLAIKRFLARLPEALSGGERQRVALARAILLQPKVLLLDEPFSGLDAPSRWKMCALIGCLNRELGITMLYVTHDQREALSLGNRAVVLNQGSVQQVGKPFELLEHPANAFVAGFIGSPPMNIFRGHIDQRGEVFVFAEHNTGGAATGTRVEVPLDSSRAPRLASFADGNILLGIRAGDIRVREEAAPVNALIELVEPSEKDLLLHCTTGATSFCVRTPILENLQPGARVSLAFGIDRAMFFNPVSEKVIA